MNVLVMGVSLIAIATSVAVALLACIEAKRGRAAVRIF
ncbi:hypothetical protein EV286_101127 [Rhizobium sp. BK251]|nr:hypothetical protein EV286_101127 [Rhizobium sp. BK251]